MHDARFFEFSSIPAVALISDAFVEQAEYQASILNAYNTPRAFVKHPISDQTAAQMHAKADAVFRDCMDAITAPWVPLRASIQSQQPTTEDCST